MSIVMLIISIAILCFFIHIHAYSRGFRDGQDSRSHVIGELARANEFATECLTDAEEDAIAGPVQ